MSAKPRRKGHERIHRPAGHGPGSPGLLRWLVMAISVPLPWIGAGIAFVGVSRLARGLDWGAAMLALGIALIVIDAALDYWIHHDTVARADAPGLNARASRLAGRITVLDRPLIAGRGRVRIDDTLWAVEGPHDLAAGSRVMVTGCRGAVLLIERAPRTEH